MEWVKKNLGFVAGLGAAIVLMGAGVWYLLGTKNEADAVDADLQAKNSQLDTLVKRPVFPDAPNIQRTKEEEVRVANFIQDARKKFKEVAKPEGLDTASFKSQLEAAIMELIKDAERSGVKLPDKGTSTSYSFSFDEQRKQLQLPAASLAPLTVQLGDMQAISRILFDAKIPSLVSLKRAAVGTNETAGTAGLLTKKLTTNSTIGSVTYPYEVVFQGFSSELANVLNGFVDSPEAFIVKTINVERGTLEMVSTPTVAVTAAPAPGGNNPYRMDPALARRYGLGPRATPQQAEAAVAPAPVNRPGEVVLEEKPLRITMGLELVKLLPAEKPAASGAGKNAK